MASEPKGRRATQPARIADRYDVAETLGSGGMASVYRATDSATGRQVAVKQLAVSGDDKRIRDSAALFEREFYTLSELSHPRIIEVYDYGIDPEGPYYTMELLEGKDLRERSPVPWREACALLFDICSSLALIHSRRLVHRDVSPRNVRCTLFGHAKLIDFGAMVPAGHGSLIVGTPPFVAPEVVHLSALDARTDLYSVGATLYYALTGRSPYPAREFSQLPQAWRNKPLAPGVLVAGIPEVLDALVLSLLNLEPAMRPRTAFEVMQRLAAIAGIESSEPPGVSRAYLTSPVLVGRDELIGQLRQEMEAAFAGHGRTVLLEAAAGVGRSRMLDQCVFEAKTLGANVLRIRARSVSGGSLDVARSLAEQLLEVLPEAALSSAASQKLTATLLETGERPRLRDLPADGAAGMKTQRALAEWLLGVAGTEALMIAVDDVHSVDEASAAVLATVASAADGQRLLLVVTADSDAPRTAKYAFDVLAGESKRYSVSPLTRAHTQRLFDSVFGDVPNVGILSDRIYAISAGNPRACMDLAQHLVDRGVILYGGGNWSLPARLDAADLPHDAEAAILERIARLGGLPRWLAEAQALASHSAFTREDYALLCPDAKSSVVDRALTELVFHQVLASDGQLHTLAHRGWASSLIASLSDAERAERHRALAGLYEKRPGLTVIRHQLAGGMTEPALDRLAAQLEVTIDSAELRAGFQLDAREIAEVFEDALKAAIALGRKPRELTMLRRWIASLAVASDDGAYWRSAPLWLKQLEHDSGLLEYQRLREVSDPIERRTRALQHAHQRYLATPESERVYRPDEAIRNLVQYVAISIAIGARSQNVRLVTSLSPLLEPFASLSPAVDAIWHNARATAEARCFAQPERARSRWIDVYNRLSSMTAEQLPAVEIIRHAIAAGIGAVEAQMGLISATTWAELLEQDPLQQVHALYLRKVVRMQQGDWEGAERFRKQAELLELSARTRQMFTSSLMIELAAHALASDLTGIKQVMDRIEPLATEAPGWAPYRHLAEGLFQKTRGDFALAREAFERCLELCTPDPDDPYRALPAYPPAVAGYIETLIALGHPDRARTIGEQAIRSCRELDIGVSAHEIGRALALAEAKLGDGARAAQRLEAIIAEQLELGVSGLNLGASYEARARIAVWAGDEPSVDQFAHLTAREYRRGRGSPLGARYERLMDEARRIGGDSLPRLSEFDWSTTSSSGVGRLASAADIVTSAFSGMETREQRAERALTVMCKEWDADAGYLYLFAEGGRGEAELTHIASLGASTPPEGLLDFLNQDFGQGMETMQTMTVAFTSLDSSGPVSATVFTDTKGTAYEPAPLFCVVDGEARHAGIAVLVRPKRPPSAQAGMLTAAIGAHLIRVGDTRGMPVGN
jgi:serine/threonine-protein kinase